MNDKDRFNKLIIGILFFAISTLCFSSPEIVSIDSQGEPVIPYRIDSYSKVHMTFSENADSVVFTQAHNISNYGIYDDGILSRRDRVADTLTELVLPTPFFVSSPQYENPSMTPDGRFIVFDTFDRLLYEDIRFPSSDIYLYDSQLNQLHLLSVDSQGNQLNGHNYNPVISNTGRYVAFKSSNPNSIIYVLDRQSGILKNICSNGTPDQLSCDFPSISADGQRIAFQATRAGVPNSGPHTNVYVHDLRTNETELVGNNPQLTNCFEPFSYNKDIGSPSISANGRYISFIASDGINCLIEGYTIEHNQVFVYDLETDQLEPISINTENEIANNHSGGASLSAQGEYVVYSSRATNLDGFHLKRGAEIYMRDRINQTTIKVTRPLDNTLPERGFSYGSSTPKISQDGNAIVFYYNGNEGGLIEGYGSGIYAIENNLSALGPASFDDVPTRFWAFDFIQALIENDAALPCQQTPLHFCPREHVTRAEFSFFLSRAKYGIDFAPGADRTRYNDVTSLHPFFRWIDWLAEEQIYFGCGNRKFCPDQTFTRAQLAKWVLKAKHGGNYVPPTASGSLFSDVASSNFYADWIEQFGNERIITGCSSDLSIFCPNQKVSRAILAMVLVRAFGLD